MRCPICSSPLKDGATKCDECGCGILPPPPAGIEPTPFVRAAATPKWPLVLSIIGVVAALVVIAVALFPLFDDDDSTVSTATTEVAGSDESGAGVTSTTRPAATTVAPVVSSSPTSTVPDEPDESTAGSASTAPGSSDPDEATSTSAGPTSTTAAPGTTAASTTTTTRAPTTTAAGFPELLPVTLAEATCQAPDSTDSRGNPITFDPALTIDGISETAWRCPGASIRQALLYTFAEPVNITALAAIPGYAGSDPFNNVDRFDQNRRVLTARWGCLDAGGTETGTAEQSFNGDRRLQGITVAFEDCSQLVFEILESSAPGNRDYTAVSEVGIYGTPG